MKDLDLLGITIIIIIMTVYVRDICLVLFCPCSHYMLIGVPVTKSKTDPLTAPYQPIVPLKNLVVKALSSKTVNTISQPLPFIVASFEPKALPINYKFTYEWRSVFKQKTHYSVVLVVFTRGKVRCCLLLRVL